MNEYSTGSSSTDNSDRIVGNTVSVKFSTISDTVSQGKVDTGADLSCLHATDVTVNKDRNSVTFNSPAISNNLITMDLSGVQDVNSADGGKSSRPTIKFDIEVNGIPIQGVMFNLNDRSNMDSMILIGQNVLKAGNFQIDVNKDADDNIQVAGESAIAVDVEQRIVEALQILYNNNITLADIVKYYSQVHKE
jgi:hypothetical protein